MRSWNAAGRAVVLSLLMLVLVMSAAVAQMKGVTETKLDNGLVVLMKEVHTAPVFTAQVWFKVGSRNEHAGITGISHLLEHMLFSSSKNYKKGEIPRLVHERGGIDNAATWTDFTYYWQLLSSDHMDFAMKTLAERIDNELLLNSEMQKERTVVLSELEGDENDPDTLLYQDVMATAFKSSPYHWPTIGWRSDVENVDRDQLYNYYHAYYHPDNATLVLVGDFNSQKALQLVKKYFGSKPAAKLPRPVYTTEPPQHGERTVTIRREGTAERVMMGYHIPALTDPDTYPLVVLDQVMSGGRSSRLYQALVEKQLATSAWSSGGARKDPSLFMLGATARQGVNADTLEKALLDQVNIAKTTLPTDEEMKAAKNQLEAYFVFQNDSVSDQGEQLGYYNTVASWKYLQTLIPKIKAVTPQDVQRVAKKYFVQDNLTVGKFIPTGPAVGGEGAAPAGPMHNSKLPSSFRGVSFYAKPGAGPKMAAAPTVRKPAPKAANKPVKSLVKPYKTVLDNGMVVIVQENHSNPTVAIAGNLKAGSNFDPKGKDGVAGLTADMIDRGTQSRSALQLAKEPEQVGASISTSADVESASFSAKSLSKDFPLMLNLLSDELRNATFPQDQFDRAKGQTASALEQSKESPSDRADRAFHHSVYPDGHPYWEPTVEEAQQELQSISRDDLMSFYKTYYRPDTTIITIVGDVNTPEAVDAVKKYFADWKAAGPAPKVEIPTVTSPAKGDKIVISMPDKSEVDVVYGYPLGMRRSDPDYYAMRIMNQILGGSGALASNLGQEIREKNGYAYDVYSTYTAGLGGGPWYAVLGTNSKNTDKAIATLQKEVSRFKQTGATQQQFQRAREFIVGVFPIQLETNAGVARALLSAEFYGLGMDYLQNYARIYRGVTLQQVNAAAKKYLHPEAATLVIAGPYSQQPK